MEHDKSIDFLVFNKEQILSNLDPNKETIVAFTNKFKKSSYNHVDGYLKILFEILEIKYNVIYIGYEDDYKSHNTLIYVNIARFKKFASKYMKNKKESECEGKEYILENHKLIYEYINEKLSWITNIKYITGIATTGEWHLMLQKHTIAGKKYRNKYNELHDYVGFNESDIQEIKEISDTIVSTYQYYCNPLAFMQIGSAIFYNILKILVKNNKNTLISVDGFANDPAFFFPLLDSLDVSNRNFYFADDKRGTRNYTKFPIAELEHLVYDNHYKNNIECNGIDELFDENSQVIQNNRTENFIFMGTILNVKGNRIHLWEKYLKNFYYEKSAFYIPPVKQGIIFKPTSEKRIQLRQQNFSENLENTLKEIQQHPLYKGYLLPNAVNKEIDKYKYTFIMRCVSCCDSLNYRPVQYAYHRILFFLDQEYDPAYLQIPKHIQDKLIVHNSDDIKAKIEYFEEHQEEREEILDELWKHFEIDKWLEPEYNKKVILDYYK